MHVRIPILIMIPIHYIYMIIIVRILILLMVTNLLANRSQKINYLRHCVYVHAHACLDTSGMHVYQRAYCCRRLDLVRKQCSLELRGWL